MWPFSSKRTEPTQENPAGDKRGFLASIPWSTHRPASHAVLQASAAQFATYVKQLPGMTMDDSSGAAPAFKRLTGSNLPDALTGWFFQQGFIGYHMCALIAQQWLVDKCCVVPARDAIRHGFDIQVYDALDDDAKKEIAEDLTRANKKYSLRHNLQQFIQMGRVFGIRVAFFKFEGVTPEFYEAPFNPDGIRPGTYRGITQVDPYWCVPMLSVESASDPSSMHFYEPEWWIINGQKYHRSHLCIFRNTEVPDLLKPAYQYGGVSVPQKIVERVYAAERTANEAPQLAMTKRLTTWKTSMEEFYANQENALKHAAAFTEWRDNHGIKIVDSGDEIEQHDTALADLDETIMTQYQLVAAAANVPATKLLGTTPKGFNSTGEYEEASYHEELETIQANDLTALVDRHHICVMRSDIEPTRDLAPGSVRVEIDWLPVDSPTAKEYAEINKMNAETDNILVTAGAIDGMDVRTRLREDKNSGYTDLEEIELPVPGVTGDPMETLTNGAEEETPVDPNAPAMGATAGRSGIPG